MKQDRCKKTNCPHWLPLEQSGIGGAIPKFSRKCAITMRNVIRMKACPLDSPPLTPSGQVAKSFRSSEIKGTEAYRSELKQQIEASTAHLADLLHRYQESLKLAYKNKQLDDNQACNLMLDLDNTVAAALFTNRWTGHLGKIAACLSSRYSDSWGI